jgi:protein-S-isoprenylcysteine O-methyltransferase Ste14
MVGGIIRLAIFFGLLGAIAFAAAGTLNWPMMWAFWVFYLCMMTVNVPFMDPGLLEERLHPKEGVKVWDKWLTGCGLSLLFPVILVVAGLDYGRFHWSLIPTWASVTAFGFYLLGTAFSLWALYTNRFFSRYVRIQTDRGHCVASDGPYRFVRHPGYVGVTVATLALPIALGSWWALLLSLVSLATLLVRTVLEDRTLHEELEGYVEYAGRVRYRLIPGVW